MPRPRKPARLYMRPDTGEWVIRDGQTQRGTGARGSDGRGAAERALARYLAERETASPQPADRLTVGAVLACYARDRGPELVPKGRAVLAAALKALAPFWGDMLCSQVTGGTCRRYARERDRKPATIRREMGVLQAALRHAHREGLLTTPVVATMPPSGQPRDRWLTRSEAARLLRAAVPHVRRFILIALYTGTRASAILALRWIAGGSTSTAASFTGRARASGRPRSAAGPSACPASCSRTCAAGRGLAACTSSAIEARASRP